MINNILVRTDFVLILVLMDNQNTVVVPEEDKEFGLNPCSNG